MTHSQWKNDAKIKVGEKKADRPDMIDKTRLKLDAKGVAREVTEVGSKVVKDIVVGEATESSENQANKRHDYNFPLTLNYLHKDELYDEDSTQAGFNKVIDTHMHVNENRVTFLIRGKCVYTF